MLLCLAVAAPAPARVQMTVMPPRREVHLAIYRAADLALVREVRRVHLKQGSNQLDFRWGQARIDPSSIQLRALEAGRGLTVSQTSFPPGTDSTMVWRIESAAAGPVDLEIGYFIRGLSWRAGYTLIAGPGLDRAELESRFTITNASGEDFLNAEVSLVSGNLNLIEEFPLDTRLRLMVKQAPPREEKESALPPPAPARALGAGAAMPVAAMERRTLEDYHLYRLSEPLDLAAGRSLQVTSSFWENVPLSLLYRLDERVGGDFRRLLKTNAGDKAYPVHSPLPAGPVAVYRRDKMGRLEHLGRANTEYVPAGKALELDLGAESEVKANIKRLDFRREDIVFDDEKYIAGWRDVSQHALELANHGEQTAALEILRHLAGDWEIETRADVERRDQNTAVFRASLAPGEQKTLEYTLRVRHRREGSVPPRPQAPREPGTLSR